MTPVRVALADAVHAASTTPARAARAGRPGRHRRRDGGPTWWPSSRRRRLARRGGWRSTWVAGRVGRGCGGPDTDRGRAGGRVGDDALRGRHERAPGHRARRGRGHRSVLERIGERPDFATVFVTPPHAGALEDVVRTVDEVLHPAGVARVRGRVRRSGRTARSSRRAAVSLLAGHVGPLVPARARRRAVGGRRGPGAAGLARRDRLLARRRSSSWAIPSASRPSPSSTGSTAAPPRPAGGGRHGLGGARSGRQPARPGHAGPHRRCRGRAPRSRGRGRHAGVPGMPALRRPLVVTKAERNLVYELAGRPALEQVVAQATRLAERGGGRPARDRRPAPRAGHRRAQGALRPRRLPGAERGRRRPLDRAPSPWATPCRWAPPCSSISATPATADEDLHALVSGAPGRRGARLHLQRPGDAALRRAAPRRARAGRAPRAPCPMAGFFAAGELGPVGGRNFLHGFTASVALLRRPTPVPGGPVRPGRRARGPVTVTPSAWLAPDETGTVLAVTEAELEQLGINVVRGLAMDAPQKANSGHPGTAMALAPLAHVLCTRSCTTTRATRHWPDRDRFILSNGHASILLYSLLFLTGYGLTLDDIKQFRQWGSKTPGHPEVHLTDGGRGHHRPARPGVRQRRRHGHRRALAAGALRPRARRPPHLRLLRRRRPHGGDQPRGGVAGRPSRARPARLRLRRQPHHHRRAHRARLHRRRGRALRRLRLAHRQHRRGGQRHRRPRGRAAAGHGRRGQAVDDPAAQPHRLALAPQDRHRRGPRRPRSARTRSRETKAILGLPPDETFWVPDEVLDFYRRCIGAGPEPSGRLAGPLRRLGRGPGRLGGVPARPGPRGLGREASRLRGRARASPPGWRSTSASPPPPTSIPGLVVGLGRPHRQHRGEAERRRQPVAETPEATRSTSGSASTPWGRP